MSKNTPPDSVHRLSHNSKSYDFLFKVLLIGASKDGKQEILRRLRHEDFHVDKSGVGVDFTIWTTQLDGYIVKLQVWDTAGQEKFHTITSSYLRIASGILYVYDVHNKESFTATASLIHNTQQMLSASDSPCQVLVGYTESYLNKEQHIQVAELLSIASNVRLAYVIIDQEANSVKQTLNSLVRQMIQQRIPSISSIMPNTFQYLDEVLVSKFDDLVANGWFESYEMRIMVMGQSDVGKTTLIKALIGNLVPEETQSTNGITLFEGRCGLDIKDRKWICISAETSTDVLYMYNKMLNGTTGKEPTVQSEATNICTEIKDPDEFNYLTTISAETSEKLILKQTEITKDVNVVRSREKANKPFWKNNKLRSTITKELMKKQMVEIMQKGGSRNKIGRLVFWDFKGHYIYYTTHQTFMTYRALFTIVFDGSKKLHKEMPNVLYFPGQHGDPTTATFLEHWVSFILTFCQITEIEFPQILFIATHKDMVKQDLVEGTRKILYEEIEDLFKDHYGYKHLVLKHRLFINARDEKDPELETLKTVISQLTFANPCWGEKMPNAWVPLELEISNLVSEGRNLLSFDELKTLNEASEVFVLNKHQLNEFLKVQLSLGKIVYFDTQHLRDYVIVNPRFMVDVMRSFITDEKFWPADKSLKTTFQIMTRHGIIQKKDLFNIWRKREFSNIWPYREIIVDMLVHMDILSEQHRYNSETGGRLEVDYYIVPCMLTVRNTTNYLQKECTSQRSICLSFTFKGTMIPPALPNRVISACLSMWSLKEYENQRLLFPGFVGMSFDKSHDLLVCVQGNRVLLYITHQKSRDLIMPYVAVSTRECLNATLQRISGFYQSTNKGSKIPFQVEFTCSEMTCFISDKIALDTVCWICPGHQHKHDRCFWNVWLLDEVKKIRKFETRISEEILNTYPTDEILDALAPVVGLKSFQLGIELGLNVDLLQTIQYNYKGDLTSQTREILYIWRKDTLKPTIETLAQVLTNIEKGTLCLEQTIDSVRLKTKQAEIDTVEVEKDSRIRKFFKALIH